MPIASPNRPVRHDDDDGTRIPTHEPNPTSYFIFACPECGAQETHRGEEDDRPTTYCLNHEHEPGRITRPAHVRVEVVRADVLRARGNSSSVEDAIRSAAGWSV